MSLGADSGFPTSSMFLVFQSCLHGRRRPLARSSPPALSFTSPPLCLSSSSARRPPPACLQCPLPLPCSRRSSQLLVRQLQALASSTAPPLQSAYFDFFHSGAGRVRLGQQHMSREVRLRHGASKVFLSWILAQLLETSYVGRAASESRQRLRTPMPPPLVGSERLIGT